MNALSHRRCDGLIESEGGRALSRWLLLSRRSTVGRLVLNNFTCLLPRFGQSSGSSLFVCDLEMLSSFPLKARQSYNNRTAVQVRNYTKWTPRDIVRYKLVQFHDWWFCEKKHRWFLKFSNVAKPVNCQSSYSAQTAVTRLTVQLLDCSSCSCDSWCWYLADSGAVYHVVVHLVCLIVTNFSCLVLGFSSKQREQHFRSKSTMIHTYDFI